MKVKPKFNIGDWVSVKAYVTFNYNGETRVADKTNLEKPIIGQIVGARMKFLGTYFGGGTYHSGEYGVDGDYEPPCLQVSGSMIVWLVTEGYLNKPHEVLDEDLEIYAPVHTTFKTVPWRKTNMTWGESDKADLRKIMKDVPRDSKGRWIK